MTGIPIYAKGTDDFYTNGLGLLMPLEVTVEEQAAGKYEATLIHPIDDTYRWAQIQGGCILKIPTPVRESPIYEAEADSGETVVIREIYRVSHHYEWLRNAPKTGGKKLSYLRKGGKVVKVGEAENGFIPVVTVDGGAEGWMRLVYLEEDSHETETITPEKPGGIINIAQSRDQLFRIYSVETDTDEQTVTAKAMHIFYDQRGNLIDAEYEPENVPVATVVSEINSKLLDPNPITWHVQRLTGNVSGTYSFKTPVEAFLDPDEGIVAQTKALLVRDNFSAYLLPDAVRDRGVTVRRRKNLIGVTVSHDEADIATRVIPVGKDKDGNPLYLSGSNYPKKYVERIDVDASFVPNYATTMTARIEYDVSVGAPDEENKDKVFKTDAEAMAELYRLACLEFTENGIDLPKYGMEVDFVLLGNTEEYANYASLNAVHLYDTVTVIDELIGVTAKLRVTGYKWDALLKQYESVTLGELQELKQTVYSFNIPNGSVSGNKIMNGTADGSILRNATIQYAKIAVAAIEQLTAKSIDALVARIEKITAESIDTDKLAAELARINEAFIKKANIQWAEVGNLSAEIAKVTNATIKTADIDWAQIKDLVTDQAIITEGVGGKLMISRLAVTEANMVSLTTGELVVKGEDGSFYAISVDENGKVITTLKQINNADVEDLSINAGEKIIEGTVTAACLNATDIFADNAMIRELMAANIDVDTLVSREAFVAKLATSMVVGGKSLTQIAGEITQAQADADFATPIDSEEPPETAPAAGKLWIDRGTTPPIFRRWKGQGSSTERDWGEAFALTSNASPNAYYDNSTGLLESIDSVITTFTPGQDGSGTPGPGNIRELRGYTHSALWQNSYGQTDSVNQKSRIEFGETIYGAEIDWLNGIWKQTHWEYVLTGEESISVMTHNGAARFTIRIPDGKYRPAASRVPYCTHFYGTEAPYGANNVDYAVCVDVNLIYLTASGLLGEVVNARNYLKNQAAAGKPVRVVVKLNDPIVHTFTPAAVDVFESMLFLHVSPDTVVAPRTFAVTGTFSGWETLNSAEDIRTAQTQIQEQQQNAQAAIDELRTAVVTDNEGVHVRKVDNDDVQLIRNELLITQKDLNMVVNGKKSSTYGDGYIRLLGMVIRIASSGIVIEAAEV